MFFAQYYLDCLSQASYLIADETTGRAVVVDPRIDVDEYLDEAAARGLTVEGVVNTHLHADFISGHFEIAARTGAWIGYGENAEARFPFRPLAEGERISLGEVTLEILHTPGHTPESISVVVYERPGDTVPYGVLTGDALFIGDVGRPDLAASFGHSPERLAPMLYESVHGKLMRLPDATRLFPGHGAGSACGKNLSTEKWSTIGEQRATNYAVQPMDLDALTRPLTAAEFRTLRAAGAVVVDSRDRLAFSAGHLRGSVNIGADGRFAETSGMVVDPEATLLVVAPEGRERETVTRLARVGLENVAGYLERPEAALVELSDLVERAPRVEAAALREALSGDRSPVVVDVRGAAELAEGRIEGSVHIPLAALPARLAEVPADRPVVVHCAGGYRSSVAAGYLRSLGRTDVSDLVGGYNAYRLTAA